MRQKVKRHKVTSLAFLASFALVLGGTVWAYAALHASSQELILRFSEYVGITKTGTIADVLAFGIFGMFLVAFNFFLAINLEERERFLGRVLTGATAFVAVLIFIIISAIISVN